MQTSRSVAFVMSRSQTGFRRSGVGGYSAPCVGIAQRRSFRGGCWASLLAIIFLAFIKPAGADEMVLLLQDTAPRELATVHVDFTSAVQRGELDLRDLCQVRAYRLGDDTPVTAQYVPQASFAGDTDSADSPTVRGVLVLDLPPGSGHAYRLVFDAASSEDGPRWTGQARTSDCTIDFDPQEMAGLPHKILFDETRKEFSEFSWNDRVHHEALGGFLLRNDKQAKVSIVTDGPLCSVVRVEATYQREDGTQPPSKPRAVYDWYYFHNAPVVFVAATITQESSYRWNEVHFLELNFPGQDFQRWSSGQPVLGGELTGDSTSKSGADWAAVIDDTNAIGMFGSGRILVHDGRGRYGTYLHADGDHCWQPWDNTLRRFSGWLWIGTDHDPLAAIQAWQERAPIEIDGTLTTPSVHEAIAQARHTAEQLAGPERAKRRGNIAVATRLQSVGRPEAVSDALQGQLPDDWHMLATDRLRLAIQRGSDGIQLASLFDVSANHEHLAPAPLPLFRLTLRNTETSQQETITADQGWQQVSVDSTTAQVVTLRWQNPRDTNFGALEVTAQAQADPECNAVRWQLNVAGQGAPWSLWQVVFPQLEVVAPGDAPVLFIPRGPGEERQDVWRQAFSFQGTYPCGWTSMQFMAAYDRESRSGLYWAIHDPLGGTKNLIAESRQPGSTLTLAANIPASDMGRLGNSFQLDGEAVWQVFSGDWYDAAVIYRNWVRQQARWYPPLGSEGREDTPAWMRELCAWAQAGGTAADCASQVQRFAEYLGVPVGFHWYSWHKIPFDNDYPHYFPPADDFAEGVSRLHESNVYVMPYINGRLWDTRDQGVEDREFTRRALPAATKNEHGEPYTESYGSKESDGSPVTLAVMCPTTSLWQDEVNGIVTSLFSEYDVDGVYIDQIAAAAPVTCMDATHGHPLGGGHWWNEGYWEMLERMRDGMKPDQMLTSECNAEPFVRWFDGYLTWHWQYDGQVPAFPAIYGGAIQMFGRAYRGGDTRDLALRMKSAQQLVYGEQIGWLHPSVVDQPENAQFLRQVVRLRWQLRRYFHAGEMLRPPTLKGDIPRVRADWQWQNEWWVETDGVLTGCWRLPREDSVVVIVANVTDQTLPVAWSFDGAACGLTGARLQVTRLTSDGPEEKTTAAAAFQRQIELPPRSAWAWEITPSDNE